MFNIAGDDDREDFYSYHILDARKIKEKLNKKIVDVIITSPPYYNLKNYGVEGQIGYGQNYEEYLNDLKDVFSYCSNIVKDTGSLWIIIDTFKQNGKMKLLPFDLAKKIENKWTLQDIIIWVKDKTLPWSHKGSLRNIFEYILFFTKTGYSDFKYYIDRIKIPSDLKKWWVRYPERYNPKGKTPHKIWEIYPPDSNMWKIPIPVQGSWGNGWVRHFCPFPPKLVERILLLTTDEGDVVLDPFAGSGIVLAQARVMNRKAIGFDINEEFKRMYKEKVFPEIERLWRIRVKELEKERQLQQELQDTIKKLRKLKYPKELIKQSLKIGLPETKLSHLNSIFIIENEDKLSTPTIYLIFDDVPPDKNMIPELWDVINRKPLSSYGFTPNVQLVSRKDFVKKMNVSTDLYLYVKGNTSKYSRIISFSDWIKESCRGEWKTYYHDFIPPILADIGISVKRNFIE